MYWRTISSLRVRAMRAGQRKKPAKSNSITHAANSICIAYPRRTLYVLSINWRSDHSVVDPDFLGKFTNKSILYRWNNIDMKILTNSTFLCQFWLSLSWKAPHRFQKVLARHLRFSSSLVSVSLLVNKTQLPIHSIFSLQIRLDNMRNKHCRAHPYISATSMLGNI